MDRPHVKERMRRVREGEDLKRWCCGEGPFAAVGIAGQKVTGWRALVEVVISGWASWKILDATELVTCSCDVENIE